jgi:hypothetical protein
MPKVTKADRTELETLIEDYLTEQGEAAPEVLVDALTAVGVGYFMHELGYMFPVSKVTEHKQMAGFLVSTYLRGTRPSPLNNYLTILQQSGAAYLNDLDPEPDPPVSGAVVTILATLAMGYTKETDPKATRMGALSKFIDLYIDGR